MKRNHSLTVLSPNNRTLHKRRVAYHEAGHAVAILINNELKQLPPVFFQINVHDMDSNRISENLSTAVHYSAEINGGRLIKDLPESLDCFIESIEKNRRCGSFFTAFIADMLNLLIGPLAEAKYTAISDDEVFNKRLITLSALHNYGGSSDLSLINEYLGCFADDKNEQEQLLTELLMQAFDFIANASNWKKISVLAQHIIDKDIKAIDCNEIMALLSENTVYQ